jgi:hypothetical protein
MKWAELAIDLARKSRPAFGRKSSALWLDADHLATNMLAAIGDTKSVSWFVSQLDRCSAREVGQLVTERFGKERLCRDMNKAEAAELLDMLQEQSVLIRPKQLGPMGPDAWEHERLIHGYACEASEEDYFQAGAHPPFGRIPYLVEAWAATCTPVGCDLRHHAYEHLYQVRCCGLTINRTPALIDCTAYRHGQSRNVILSLGHLECELALPRGSYAVALNITSPFIPILGDNKVPYLRPFGQAIIKAIEAAVRRSKRKCAPILVTKNNGDNNGEDIDQDEETPEKRTQKEQVLEILERGEAQQSASGGKLQFNQRSLYHVVRDMVPGLTSSWFEKLVTKFENKHGEIELMFRTDRGIFYEPHSGGLSGLGTLSVEAYET